MTLSCEPLTITLAFITIYAGTVLSIYVCMQWICSFKLLFLILLIPDTTVLYLPVDTVLV